MVKMSDYFRLCYRYTEANFYTDYLTSDDLTLDGVKQLLGTDFVCADQVNSLHDCPLLIALTNKKCSIDIVEHLLQYNSSTNCRDKFGLSCLFVALFNSQDIAIVRVLLEKGAKVLKRDYKRLSLFCIAIHHYTSTSIIKLLLEAKISSMECGHHGSLMHCALSQQVEGITGDFLELLLSAGGDLNSINENGQSPLCVAFKMRRDVREIDLLLSKGASLDACQLHKSPMLCATNCNFISTTLKADVVRLLIEKGAATIETGTAYTPLQWSLLRNRYEVEAIRLMLDHSSEDVSASHDQCKSNLLHIALRNPLCKVSVVQLLINRGVRVDEKNGKELIPMYEALMRTPITGSLNPGIIEVLLQNGSPVNGLPESRQTPLRIAVIHNLNYYILKLLIGAGASVDLPTKYCNITFLKSVLEDKKIECFKLLLKCSYLENSDFDIQCLGLDRSKHSELFVFADECRSELQRMELQKLSCKHTFRDFVSKHCFLLSSTMTDNDYDQLLRILSNNVFHIYFEVIVAKIGRPSMEAKIEEVPVYTFENYSSSSCTKRCIVLNYVSVRKIIRYLSDEYLMLLILSYFEH